MSTTLSSQSYAAASDIPVPHPSPAPKSRPHPEPPLALVWHSGAQAVSPNDVASNDLAIPASAPATLADNPAKRALDLTLLVLALPLLLPLVAAVALAVRLSSPGPVLFRQRRIGRNGHMFAMLKFRSMIPNAQQALEDHLAANPEARKEWEETQKLKNDPRITPIGHLIRRTSLDELPQLWNVFKGDMSIVGPRPIVADEAKRYRNKFRYYIAARPGCTGLWQVSGRNDTSYDERVDLDTHYVTKWSLKLDLSILWRTVGVLMRGSGAY